MGADNGENKIIAFDNQVMWENIKRAIGMVLRVVRISICAIIAVNWAFALTECHRASVVKAKNDHTYKADPDAISQLDGLKHQIAESAISDRDAFEALNNINVGDLEKDAQLKDIAQHTEETIA